LVTVHLIPYFFLLNNRLGSYFVSVCNASNLQQTWQTLHANDHLTSLYTPVWSSLANWHHVSYRVGLKRPNHAPFNCQIRQFMMLILSQQLRFFLTELRAKFFSQWRQDCPLPSPINRGGFNDSSMKKIRFKVGKKIYFPIVFCRLFIFLSPPWPSATTTIIIHVHYSCGELWAGSDPTQNKKEEKKDLLGRNQPNSLSGRVQSNSFGLSPA
jgi:hypothetical protein